MKYLSYRRVSKREKDTGSVSLEWQRAEIDRWLSRKKVILDKDHCDDGISAQRPLGRRPGGSQLVADAADGPCTVICAHMDRIFRSSREFQNQTYEWASKGILFVAVNGGVDLATPEGRCFAVCMSAFHQLEREKVSERAISRGVERKRLGMRHLRDAEYGFRFDGETIDSEGKRHGGKYVRDEAEQAVIKKIREWRRNLWTLRKIAAELNILGIETRRGKPWQHSSVQKIIDTISERIGKKKKQEDHGLAAPCLTLHVDENFKESGE
jgi:DNA invertase Pin-like site-specific DNA recombinase